MDPLDEETGGVARAQQERDQAKRALVDALARVQTAAHSPLGVPPHLEAELAEKLAAFKRAAHQYEAARRRR